MSITNKLNQIKNAIYGKEVRGAIHDAIKQVYDDASVNHDNANMEVKMARGTHNTLNDRLDNVDEIQAQTNAQLSEFNIDLNNAYNSKLNPLNSLINVGTLSHFINSLGKKECIVAFWGDSITANGDQVDTERKYVDIFAKKLEETFSQVNFTFHNFGLGGRTIEQASDENYLSGSDFNATWATITGKSWRDYVKDSNPDLIILAFGMNGASKTIQNKNSLDKIETFINTFNKKPSLICLTNFLPRKEWIGEDSYINRIECARSTIEWCRVKGYTCFDIYGTYSALVDGADNNNLIAKMYTNFDSNFYLGSNNEISKTFTNQYYYTQEKYYNVRVRARLNITSGSITHIRLRDDLFVFIDSHHNYSVVQTGAVDIFRAQFSGDVTNLIIDIKLYGSLLELRIGSTVQYLNVFNVFKDGRFAIGAETGTVTVSDIKTYTYTPTKVRKILTMDDVVGTYKEEDYSLQLPLGGNGVNHPTSIGTYYLYVNHIAYFCDVISASVVFEKAVAIDPSDMLNGWSGSLLFINYGNIVELHGNIKGGTPTVGETGYAFEFPKGFEPMSTGDYVVPSDSGGALFGGLSTVRIDKTANKLMVIKSDNLTATDYVRIHITYLI